MKNIDLENFSCWLVSGYEILCKNEKTEDIFDRLYHGKIEPEDIFDALEDLDFRIGEELENAIEYQTMDAAHPEAILFLEHILSEHGKLLFRLRIENAFASTRLLLGWSGQTSEQAKYSLRICVASEWEAVCWSLTWFWVTTRDQFLRSRSDTLSNALIQKGSNRN